MQIVPKNKKLGFDRETLRIFFEKKYNMEFAYQKYFEYVEKNKIIVLNQAQREYIFQTTKEVNNIFLKAYNFYFQEKNIHLLGEKSLFNDYVGEIFPRENYCIGRYDILIDRETFDFKFIEFNANTPGLITDIGDICGNFLPKDVKNFNSIFEEHILSYFQKYKDKKIAILLPHAFEDEDFLVAKTYQSILEKGNFQYPIIIGDIYDTNITDDQRFFVKAKEVEVILNFFPLEFFLTDMGYAQKFFSLVKSEKITLINPMESIVFQDKKMFSIIWKYKDTFSKKHQEIIQKHIPYSVDIITEKEEEKYLAKARFSRMSRGVFDGNFSTYVDKKDDFVFQEKIQSFLYNNKNEFLVLGIFTDLQKVCGIIARSQSDFITSDAKNNNKIILVANE